jgi:hypothetical protein
MYQISFPAITQLRKRFVHTNLAAGLAACPNQLQPSWHLALHLWQQATYET